MQQKAFRELFEKFETIKVGVVGDVMLDTYWWGNVDRISPEAPVPVVAVTKRELRLGGAANVALNLKSLGAHVQVLSVTGADEDAEQLCKLFEQAQLGYDYVCKSVARTTTNKIRIISRNQHMMRLDAEVTEFLNKDDEANFINRFKIYIGEQKPQIVILEDYNKGVLTETVIGELIKICKQENVLIAVDPKRKNFFAYKGVDIFKPNLHEVKDALNLTSLPATQHSLTQIHEQLHQQLQHKISFITLSEKGVFYQHEQTANLIPTHVRSIADVSGAGDTVIAVAALVYAASGNEQLMAEIANIAGGLVCEEVGTVAIDKTKLFDECLQLLAK